MRPMVFVAAAALVDIDGRVLICQRTEGEQLVALGEFPTNKVSPRRAPMAPRSPR